MSRWAHVVGGICDVVVNSESQPTVSFRGGIWVDAGANAVPGWAWNGTSWSAPSESVRTITLRQFWARFTPAEREALQDKLATGTQAVKNKISAFRDYLMTGGNVELDDDYIIASVTLMESAGVIGSGRANQILS